MAAEIAGWGRGWNGDFFKRFLQGDVVHLICRFAICGGLCNCYTECKVGWKIIQVSGEVQAAGLSFVAELIVVGEFDVISFGWHE